MVAILVKNYFPYTFQCHLSCYKRDTELIILWHVNKPYVIFLFTFWTLKWKFLFKIKKPEWYKRYELFIYTKNELEQRVIREYSAWTRTFTGIWNKCKHKQSTSLVCMTKNYELCILLKTMRLTLKFGWSLAILMNYKL